MLPNFIVIGAPRCGTTTICDQLNDHPEVFVTDPKEPEFFNNDTHWARGASWYERCFEDAIEFSAVGEGSAHYSCATVYPDTPRRIASLLPACRLVLAVRHPIRRIESHWKLRRAGGCAESLSDCIERHLSAPLESNVTAGSFYYAQVQRFLEFFSLDQLCIVFLEDWVAQPHRELGRILNHIGVSHLTEGSPIRHSHSSSDWRKDTPILSAIRTLPGISTIQASVPSSIKSLIRPIFTNRALAKSDRAARLSDTLSTSLLKKIRPDASAFLKLAGKPLNFWNM